MSNLNYKPCHIPLKYRCAIKKSDHIRSTYLRLSGGVCSRQAVEAGKALNSSLAFVPKAGLQVHCTQEPSYQLKPGDYASHCSESVERVHRKNHKSHRSAMEDVVRNFEEIDKILEETKFNMKQSSNTDVQHRPGPYNINIVKETPPAWKEVGDLRRESPREGVLWCSFVYFASCFNNFLSRPQRQFVLLMAFSYV